MRTSVKRILGLGLVGAAAYAIWRAWNAQKPAGESRVEWTSSPFPYPPVPRVEEPDTPVAPTAEPNGDGTCPATHPIKGKLGSGIYHMPGGANYERTKPDRCYADEAAATADGLRRSKA